MTAEEIQNQSVVALKAICVFTILLGLFYPALVTAFGQILFPKQAQGSLIVDNGQVRGSALIGQFFGGDNYFWGRPSATSPDPYNSASSSGSNWGPNNPALWAAVKQRVSLYLKNSPGLSGIPADLVTASGSGLDPDISPEAAFFQVKRVAHARGISEAVVQKLVQTHIQKRQWGFLGEPRVNVLLLNTALDQISKNSPVSR
jgi:K+-transporting ATPase ATPase C chain